MTLPTLLQLPDGYRVVRSLGHEPHECWLVSIDGARPLVAHRCASARPIDVEPCSVAARHQLELHECLSLDDGSALVLEEWAEHGSFAPIWFSKTRGAGEAVTALVPFLEYLSDMASAGWYAPDVQLSDLLLDAQGRVRVRHGVAWQRERSDSNWPERYQRSFAALQAVVQTVLDSAGVEVAVAEPAEPNLAKYCATLADRLTATIPAAPIALGDDLALSATPWRLGGSTSIASELAEEPPSVGGRLLALYDSALHRAAVTRQLSKVLADGVVSRGRVLLVGSAAAALVLLALWLLPADAAPVSGGRAPTDAVPTTLATGAVGGGTTAPAEAARALLAEREHCLASTNALQCLAASEQPGSALYASDVTHLADRATGLEPMAQLTTELISDMGQAALVAIHGSHTTASVLLVQTEAGWRLREIFD